MAKHLKFYYGSMANFSADIDIYSKMIFKYG